MHVVHLIANNSTVPYLTCFAERLGKYPDIKFSFVTLHHEKPKMVEEMRKYGCEAYWIKFDHRKRKSGMVSSFFSLARLFRKLKPDVVNTHLFDDSLQGLLAARLTGVKIRVIHKQDTGYHWNFKPSYIWADKFNNNNATHIVAVSGESKKFILEKEKANPSKVYLIHSGIDLDYITRQDENVKQALAEKYKLKGKFVIGTIARYIEWKGYKYIIDAAKIAVEKNKNLKFLFVGHGSQEQELREMVAHYGLNDYIEFIGWMDRKKIPSLYGVMNLFLHAATMEPFGFVIAEAMANGVPILTTRTGFAPDELTHLDSCYFAESNNNQSIAEGIDWMAAHPEEREKMKQKVKKIAAERLSVDRMLDDFIKLYRGQLKP